MNETIVKQTLTDLLDYLVKQITEEDTCTCSSCLAGALIEYAGHALTEREHDLMMSIYEEWKP